MLQEIDGENRLDESGNPAGGDMYIKGDWSIDDNPLYIRWQDGPLGRGEDRKEPNGVFVETVIQATIQRIEFYQSSKFNCVENQMALAHLKEALSVLQRRTADREKREVEGTHEV